MLIWFSRIFLCLSLWVVGGCTTFHSQSGKMRLEQFESLYSSGADKQQTEKALGKPDRTTQVMSADDAAILDVWLYFDGHPRLPRMVLFFEPASGKLKRANWHVRDNDFVTTMTSFSARYPQISFSKENLKRHGITTGALPRHLEFYKNPDVGIFVGMSEEKNRIDMINWSDPHADRQPTSRK